MFDPGWGAMIPRISAAKKPKHRTETILLTNSIKILKMVHTRKNKIFLKALINILDFLL